MGLKGIDDTDDSCDYDTTLFSHFWVLKYADERLIIHQAGIYSTVQFYCAETAEELRSSEPEGKG